MVDFCKTSRVWQEQTQSKLEMEQEVCVEVLQNSNGRFLGRAGEDFVQLEFDVKKEFISGGEWILGGRAR